MLIEHGFQVARDDGLGDRVRILLPTSRERCLKKRAVQIGAKPVPARIEKPTVALARDTFRVEAVQASAEHDTGTGQRELRESRHFALRDGANSGVRGFTPLFKNAADRIGLS